MQRQHDVVMQQILAEHVRFCQRMYVLQTLLPYTAISVLSALVAYSVGQIGHETCQMLLKICLVPENMLNGMLAYIQYDYRFSLLQNVIKAINHEMAPNAWHMHWHMQILAFVMTFISLSMLYQLCHIQEFGILGFHVKRADPTTYLQQQHFKWPEPPTAVDTTDKPLHLQHQSYKHHAYKPRRLRYHYNNSHQYKYNHAVSVD